MEIILQIRGQPTFSIYNVFLMPVKKKLDVSSLSEMTLKLALMCFPVGTGRKLNVHKTFRGHPGRLLNVLCMFNLRPVSLGS